MRRTKSCWTAVDLLSSRHFFRSRSRLRSSRSLSRRPHSEPQVRSDSRSQFRRYQQQKLRRTKSCWTAVGLLSSRCFFRSRRARPPLPPVCHMLSISAAAESLFTVLCNLLHLCGVSMDAPPSAAAFFTPSAWRWGTVGTVGCEWVPVLLLGAQLVASGGIRRPLRIAAPFCPAGSSFPFFLHRIHGGLSRSRIQMGAAPTTTRPRGQYKIEDY